MAEGYAVAPVGSRERRNEGFSAEPLIDSPFFRYRFGGDENDFWNRDPLEDNEK